MKNKVSGFLLVLLVTQALTVYAANPLLASCSANSDCTSAYCANNVCCTSPQCGIRVNPWPGDYWGAAANSCYDVLTLSPDGKHKCMAAKTWKLTNTGYCSGSEGEDDNSDCASNFCVDNICCNPGSCSLHAGQSGAVADSCYAQYTLSPDGKRNCTGPKTWKNVNNGSCISSEGGDDNSDCASNFCVDNICCDFGSCSLKAGKNGATANSCYQVGSLSPDGKLKCMAAKTWKLTNTGFCSDSEGGDDDSDCASNYCDNNVCCSIGQCGLKNKTYGATANMCITFGNPAPDNIHTCVNYSGSIVWKLVNNQTCSASEGGDDNSDCASNFCVDNICCDPGSCSLHAGVNGATASSCYPIGSFSPDGKRKCVAVKTWKNVNTQPCSGSEGEDDNSDCVSNFCVDNICCDFGSCSLAAGKRGAVANSCYSLYVLSPDGLSNCTAPKKWTSINTGYCVASEGGDDNSDCASNFCVDNVCCDPGSCSIRVTGWGDSWGAAATSCYKVGDLSPDGTHKCVSPKTWKLTNTGYCVGSEGEDDDSDCVSNNCVDNVCCDVGQCGGIDINGDRVCYNPGEMKDFGRYTCAAGGEWKISDNFGCSSDSMCLCGDCVDGLCCGPGMGPGSIYFMPEAPFYPGAGWFSISMLLNKKIVGSTNLGTTVIKDGDDVCCTEGGNLISITTNPKGEFYSVGGPVDTPPIVYVSNLEATKAAINAGTYVPPVYELSVCDHLYRCEEGEHSRCSPLPSCLCSTDHPCRCMKYAAVICEAPCTTQEMSPNAYMINATTINVTGPGQITVTTDCNIRCIIYWQTDPHFSTCSWYAPATSWSNLTLGGSATQSFTDVLNITAVDSEVQDTRRPNITVQNRSFAGTALLVKLKNVGDYDAYLDMASLNIDAGRYTVAPDVAASNILMAPAAEQDVLFTFDDLTGLTVLTASFGYHYSKGGACNGSRALSETITVPVGPGGVKNVTFVYRITSGKNVTCDLWVTNSTGDWIIWDTRTELYKGNETSFHVPDIKRENYRWKVKCWDYTGIVVEPSNAPTEGWGFNVTG